MRTETKTCLNCGKPVLGRIDKKFCDDQCRNTFNNQQFATSNNLIRNINHALKKNRNILESMIPSGEELSKPIEIDSYEQGFSLNITHIATKTKKETNTIIAMILDIWNSKEIGF